MSDIVVTKEQIKQLIKDEALRPEDLFDDAGLKEVRDIAEARGYARAAVQRGVEEAARDLDKEEPKADDKYLDPATNPMIKTGAPE